MLLKWNIDNSLTYFLVLCFILPQYIFDGGMVVNKTFFISSYIEAKKIYLLSFHKNLK